MKVFGGFAGHGFVHGVRIDASTLRRFCTDCGHSWLDHEDSDVRRAPRCISRAIDGGRASAAHRQLGSDESAFGQTLIGIDLGATWLRLCRISSAEAAVLKIRTPSAANARERLSRELQKLLPRDNTCPRIGLARAPGIDAGGRVTAWPSKPDWVNVQLLQIISATASAPTRDADDGVCAALWEHRAHSHHLRPGSTTACLTVGTGLGVGVVRDGRSVPTGDGADTVAHLPLGVPDAACACGRTGCLQATLSAETLAQHLACGDAMKVVAALNRLVMYLRDRYDVDQIVLTGGGLPAMAAAQLIRFAGASHAGTPRLTLSATPALSALGGALLLAAGTSADRIRVIARLAAVLQQWQTLMSMFGTRRAMAVRPMAAVGA